MNIELAGERVELRADRSLAWPARKTLVIADPHFGKADAFRAAGVPMPGSGTETLLRLSNALLATHAERLIVLGDIWHHRAGRTAQVFEALRDWRSRHAELHIDLIRGNHDHGSPLPPTWSDAWQCEPLREAPFVFAHHPQPLEHGYVLAGHIHPGVVLRGRARQRLRLPAFWIASQVAVLPAFGLLTGLATAVPEGSRIYAIADNEVFQMPVH